MSSRAESRDDSEGISVIGSGVEGNVTLSGVEGNVTLSGVEGSLLQRELNIIFFSR
jgi:hypothetical protein